MKRNKRILAAALTAALLIPQLGLTVSAAAPAPTTDEAVYVSLDAYGALSDMRVVKSVNRNGASRLSDYGSYAAVYNMSSHDEPSLREDGVDFDLTDADSPRFYYECIPSDPDALQMPWTFDVSYKLNGVPAAAETLAGASGLVEITIHAIPNPAADEYYRNNMTLLVGTGVNMDETKSIEAPGAQLQSVGSYKFAAFMGLPGEDNTYTIRIGSDSFESMGIYMMMAPATLSQLDTIADFRDVRDRLEGAHDDVYAGLSDMLTAMNGMQGGLNRMAAGISGIDEVRRKLIDARGTIDPELDAALTVLDTLAGDTDALIPELDTVQANLTQVNADANALHETVNASRSDIEAYSKLLKSMDLNLKDAQSLVADLKKTGDPHTRIAELRKALKAVGTDAAALADELEDMQDDCSVIQSTQNLIKKLVEQLSIAATPQYDAEGNVVYPGNPALLQMLRSLSGSISSLDKELTDLSTEYLPDILTSTRELLGSLRRLTTASDAALGDLDALCDVIDQYDGLTDAMLSDGRTFTEAARQTLAHLTDSLDALDALNATMDKATDDANSLVGKSSSLLQTASSAVRTANTLLTDVRDTLRSVRSRADESTAQLVDGLTDVITRAADTGGTTGSLQNATDSIHNTISDEANRLDEDSNVLNMDNSLALRSFTSDKNPAPSSLQFILRTSEISVDEIAAAQAEEAAEQDVGVWGRILNIFKKLFSAIAGVFA